MLNEKMRVIVWAKGHPFEGERGVIKEIIGRYIGVNIQVFVALDDVPGVAVISPQYLLAEADEHKGIPKVKFEKRKKK